MRAHGSHGGRSRIQLCKESHFLHVAAVAPLKTYPVSNRDFPLFDKKSDCWDEGKTVPALQRDDDGHVQRPRHRGQLLALSSSLKPLNTAIPQGGSTVSAIVQRGRQRHRPVASTWRGREATPLATVHATAPDYSAVWI